MLHCREAGRPWGTVPCKPGRAGGPDPPRQGSVPGKVFSQEHPVSRPPPGQPSQNPQAPIRPPEATAFPWG